jgi:hypothetical protein
MESLTRDVLSLECWSWTDIKVILFPDNNAEELFDLNFSGNDTENNVFVNDIGYGMDPSPTLLL